MRINSMTPSSSSQHIVGMMNGCNGDNASDHNRTLERDGRNSSISTSHSPHRTHTSNITSNITYNNTSENQNNKSHHHSLDRESNNKTYREMGTRQFYNTNPKPQGQSKQQKQQKLQQSNNLCARQSMPLKTVAKSQSNLSNTTIISKSDANMAINSSDECLNIDRMSIHSQCNSEIYKNRHMILASSNKSSKQYCKYHNFN